MTTIGIGVQVTNLAAPASRRVARVLSPEYLRPVVGRAASNVYRTHLFALDRERPNAMGGQRTHFYAQAARGTQFTHDADGVTISIVNIGIRQRFYGGVIRPKNSKWLTIPANPAAHGKRAREFDLEVIYDGEGRPIALATKSTRAVQITQNARGNTVRKSIGRHGVIMYWLKKSVTQAPDPTVLAPIDKVAGAIISNVNAVVDRAIQGSGGKN